MSYAEAMHRFGSDKPDLRVKLELTELTDIMGDVDFKVFSAPAQMNGGRVVALCVRGGAEIVRHDNAFLCGDAAGLATVDMGEGIGPAVASGLRAARAISDGADYHLRGIAHHRAQQADRRQREAVVERRGQQRLIRSRLVAAPQPGASPHPAGAEPRNQRPQPRPSARPFAGA